MCEQHGIYKPTYPVEKMTLAELERAALGPHRFIKSIDEARSRSSERPVPYLARQFRCRKRAREATGPNDLYAVSHLALVPGGRFLFTAAGRSGDDPKLSVVCLWDLGHNMRSPIKAYPIASVSSPRANLIHISAFPSSRGREIVVAIHGQW